MEHKHRSWQYYTCLLRFCSDSDEIVSLPPNLEVPPCSSRNRGRSKVYLTFYMKYYIFNGTLFVTPCGVVLGGEVYMPDWSLSSCSCWSLVVSSSRFSSSPRCCCCVDAPCWVTMPPLVSTTAGPDSLSKWPPNILDRRSASASYWKLNRNAFFHAPNRDNVGSIRRCRTYTGRR